ncbi:hypothetical protein SKAU_G00379340 [Synaphobranchus kaupii]|uniref:Uncharacterized protein n=1 Tax=Synaphobranchus kaupii TaxID=118154 RepID=A0A9Q1EDB7_SYNKA|nr:hypothetical protein SKAU_G00379340 [Synaphobranchus kaupii]
MVLSRGQREHVYQSYGVKIRAPDASDRLDTRMTSVSKLETVFGDYTFPGGRHLRERFDRAEVIVFISGSCHRQSGLTAEDLMFPSFPSQMAKALRFGNAVNLLGDPSNLCTCTLTRP